MADRLDWRRWPNQKKCLLCRHTDESALHLFAQCRYTRRLWTELGASVPTTTANMASWDTCDSTAQWWKVASASTELSPNMMRSLLLLVSWEIWNERNGRIFRHKESSVLMCLQKSRRKPVPGAWQELIVWVIYGPETRVALIFFLYFGLRPFALFSLFFINTWTAKLLPVRLKKIDLTSQ